MVESTVLLRLPLSSNPTHPLRVLERPRQQPHQMMYGPVFAQRHMIGRAQRQIPDQPDDGLDQWPARRRLQQFHDHLDAVVEAHRVLGHLGLHVTRGQVAEGADRRLGYLLAIPGVHYCADQSVDATHLADCHLYGAAERKEIRGQLPRDVLG